MADLQMQEYSFFIKDIKEKIYKSQYEALKTLNTALIKLYWDIGEEIFNQQKEKGWGKSIVEILAKELQNEFPGIKGFSAGNLWRMRNFYISYVDDINLAPLVREISWTKNIVIMEKCKDKLEQEFYIKMTKRFGWTKNVLVNNIENKAYEKYLLNQTNFDETVPEKYRQQAKLAVKDEYTFDFLEMGIEHSEQELEVGLINNIRAFLSEMGGTFAFIGNQYHIDIGGEDFYIDLLLFHRKLKSLIAIELKIGEFKPEYAGKMQFYLTVLDERVKFPDENASVGIIICKSKNRTIVEYALKSANKPIGVSTYNISSTLPDEMKNLLPTPEEIIERLSALDDN
jgi:predicted nuclease of restriction endonuclease-like (RecB) superfamily